MDIKQTFGFNLRRSRIEAGLTQQELACRVGLHRTYISALERGMYAASIDVVGRLAKELGVEPSELLRVLGQGELRQLRGKLGWGGDLDDSRWD